MKKHQDLQPHLEKILITLPKSPGVYQMKDGEGKVIYVGKAKSLWNRVNSYFDRTTDLTAAKKQMVAKIRDIEIIHCETEVEALVLETNLIKHLSPKYNILMKDDKNLAYLKITKSPVPELIKTRNKCRDGGEYFGPYVSGVEQSVRILRRILKIRNCRVQFSSSPSGLRIIDKAGKTLPCMDYYIGLCPAPCLLEQKGLHEHEGNIERARMFLQGRLSDVVEKIQAEMKQKVETLEFEKAQELKEALQALSGLHERQKVRDIVEGNVDIFLKYEKYDKSYIALTQIRNSQIIGVFRHEVDIKADDSGSIVSDFLMRQYLDQSDVPDLLLLAETLDDQAFIDFLRGEKIVVEYPQIGPKKELIEFTRNQLRDYAYKREMATLENKTLTKEHMKNILEKLNYPSPKTGDIIFECYDISHTDGHFTYASRVVIVNGKPDTKQYKKYKIKTLEDGKIDDFASHREVMLRRTLEGIEYENFPHLIIIDGGKGQLSSALAGIQQGYWEYKNKIKIQHRLLGENDGEQEFLSEKIIPLCSIAKREEELFLPKRSDPIIFQEGSPELMVLQKARDESHRFSIGANKAARMKSMKKNILEELPGFGPVTRKKILKLSGGINEIRTISFDELSKICSSSQIQTLRDHGLI